MGTSKNKVLKPRSLIWETASNWTEVCCNQGSSSEPKLHPRKERRPKRKPSFFWQRCSFNSVPSCETSGRSVNCPVPQFPHLENEDNSGILSESEVRGPGVSLPECLAQSGCSVNVGCDCHHGPWPLSAIQVPILISQSTQLSWGCHTNKQRTVSPVSHTGGGSVNYRGQNNSVSLEVGGSCHNHAPTQGLKPSSFSFFQEQEGDAD